MRKEQLVKREIMFGILDIFKRLNSASKWLVLWTVYQAPGLTGRKISKRVGFAWASVKNALEYLVMEGLILRRGENRNYYYFPNEKHYLYNTFLELFTLLEAPLKPFFSEVSEKLLVIGIRLLGLKASEKKLFFIVQENRKETEFLLQSFLREKSLPGISFEIISLKELKSFKEIKDLPGSYQGIPLEILFQTAEKEKKLTFFSY